MGPAAEEVARVADEVAARWSESARVGDEIATAEKRGSAAMLPAAMAAANPALLLAATDVLLAGAPPALVHLATVTARTDVAMQLKSATSASV